jgi:hypothetical protein
VALRPALKARFNRTPSRRELMQADALNRAFSAAINRDHYPGAVPQAGMKARFQRYTDTSATWEQGYGRPPPILLHAIFEGVWISIQRGKRFAGEVERARNENALGGGPGEFEGGGERGSDGDPSRTGGWE